MIKIIDLDIEAFLSGETRIDEVGFVFSPATEVDWVYFNSTEQQFESYDDYPKAASENACKVLRWIDEHGRDEVDGMTPTGLARANQLCNREKISEETIARMSAFERHRQNAEINPEYEGTPWKDKGYVAWLGWGGDEGIAYAKRKLEQIRNERMSSQCGCSIEHNEFSHDETHALIEAERLGCKGAHKMGDVWHPCGTHEDYEQALENERRSDEAMIEGVIEILLQIEDLENRAKVAIDVLRDFEAEGVVYDFDVFLERIGLGGPDLEYLWDDTMELEDLLDMGYVITEAKEIDPSIIVSEYKDSFSEKKITEEQFYTLTSKPNEPSLLDTPFRLRRYVYAIGPQGGPDLIPTSREFCRRMMGKRQLVWRFEDLQLLSAELNSQDGDRKIIPRPKGASVDVFIYQGGANCRHRFLELSLDPGERVSNNKQRATKKAGSVLDAPGQAGKTNEPAQVGRERNPQVVREESMSYDTSNLLPYTKEDEEDILLKDLPIGFLQGVPVYNSDKEAKAKSTAMGCEGVYEKVDYMGDEAFRPCRTRNSNEFKTEHKFKLDDEKRMIYAPAMIPGKIIRRYEPQEGEYFVRFSREAIERGAHKFLAEGRTKPEFVNYEHTDTKFDDIYLVESWIVGDEEDKIYDYGYSREDVPSGSWVVGYKVENDDLWENYVKKGLIKAVSVEGLFDMSFNSQRADEYLLNKVINILNQVD